MRKSRIIILSLVIIVVVILSGIIMSRVEQPEYAVVEYHQYFEVRIYNPMILARAEANGDRGRGINIGFRVLADYIFGKTQSSEKIDMTAPVLQQKSEDTGGWLIYFIMPQAYTIETLPKPINEDIKIIQNDRKKYVTVRFSGIVSERALEENNSALMDYIKEKRYKTIGNPYYAFYNPPWTLPFMRRNEIWYEIE